MDIYIITGASKGIGSELLKQLSKSGSRVFGMARTNPGAVKDFFTIDLEDTASLSHVLKEIISKTREGASSFTLVNNAGTVEPIGPAGSLDPELIGRAVSVNLTAPVVLANEFIAVLAGFSGPKRIMNISSGAGRNAYEGWGVYCATKAGLDHFSRVVSMEQQAASYPVKVVSIAPGIIDTGMQETIRSSEEKDFPLLSRFIDYKEKGLLSSAEETARKLIDFMQTEFDRLDGDPIADIRNF